MAWRRRVEPSPAGCFWSEDAAALDEETRLRNRLIIIYACQVYHADTRGARSPGGPGSSWMSSCPVPGARQFIRRPLGSPGRTAPLRSAPGTSASRRGLPRTPGRSQRSHRFEPVSSTVKNLAAGAGCQFGKARGAPARRRRRALAALVGQLIGSPGFVTTGRSRPRRAQGGHVLSVNSSRPQLTRTNLGRFDPPAPKRSPCGSRSVRALPTLHDALEVPQSLSGLRGSLHLQQGPGRQSHTRQTQEGSPSHGVLAPSSLSVASATSYTRRRMRSGRPLVGARVGCSSGRRHRSSARSRG